MGIIILITFWVMLAVIVAMIANAKGYEPAPWGLYGFLIFPIAIIHILLKQNLVTAPPARVAVVSQPASVADELAKFEQLRSQGVITDSEFAAQKARLIGS